MTPHDTLQRHAVPLLSGALAVLAGLLLLLAVPQLDADPVSGPSLWLLAAALVLAFAVAEAVVVHVDIGDSAHSASLIEVPLVLSLFWLPPHIVVLARVLGAVLALALVRRQSSSKLGFNACMMTLEATVAVLIFHGFGAADEGVSAIGAWSTSVLACLASSGTSSLAVIAVISGTTWQRVPTHHLRGIALVSGPTTLIAASFGFLAARAIDVDATAALPVALVGVAVAIAYSRFVALRRSHARLSSLYGFVEGVSATTAEAGPVRAVLSQTRLQLACDVAVLLEVVRHDDEGDGDGDGVLLVQRHHLGRDDHLTSAVQPLTPRDWPVSRCLLDGRSLLATRNADDPAVASYLAREDVADGVLVAVPGADGRPAGVLFVGGRRGEHSTFDLDDVVALEGLAAHAAIALQNGVLLERLTYESRHDLLTALPNRTEFQHRLQGVLDAQRPAAVLFMDLDRFKDVNDTLGHAAGDQLLRQVAARLAAAAPGSATIARLGGDEFAVVLPDVEVDAAVELATRLRAVLSAPVEVDGLSVDVGVSIGLALSPKHGRDVTTLMRRADIAMYDAKAHGGTAVYDAQRNQPSSSRLSLMAQLRAGLAQDQLRLVYHPQVRATDGVTVRVEALLRWQHPVRGLLAPDEFLADAERAGLMPDITQWVIRRSLEDLCTWRAHGLDIGVAVNLSPRNLLDADLTPDVLHELAVRALPPECLTLEITESTLMADPQRSVRVLRELSDAGLRLSVDDFGTGYSSLAYLKQLPVDEVKVDRFFVRDLHADSTDVAIVRAVVALADSLGLETVAEGVEDADSLALLQLLGCTVLQGHLLSRPLPADAVPGWVSRQRTWSVAPPRALAPVRDQSA